ncbi:toll-like receptor 5 isoform X2 [Pieris napi]|uniref:toll-like receptor 5 isoform X2 n=1 Tax=Pieris napi TaxID=78633 RepID=UPI001FB9C60C|nr:toll-like receptor 5 isoform X2 [Pieris napi]
MILRISIIYIFHLSLSQSSRIYPNESPCLTGYMTDLQSWVTKDGQLTVNDTRAIDLSHVQNVASVIEEYIANSGRRKFVDNIKYLSIAKSSLQRVPPIFTFQGNLQKSISESLEYVTFYGNSFGRIRETGAYEASINATFAKEVFPGLASNTKNKLFNYDVFVSYCNEDRAWVLDQLLPHVEIDCNISVCLHERDFQVGLSILENIVSCMDRSRSIMLIISRRFLLSQWCQFEMHLAQHRLLETRREDLILILVEEIPRRLRPNTLHFLMLTKTYIVWPKEESEKKEFWKRMKKSLVTQKLKNVENDSLA